MTDQPLDLTTIEPWIQPCGPCDYGMRMACTCPPGDYRSPMVKLVAEVERLRSEIEEMRRAR